MIDGFPIHESGVAGLFCRPFVLRDGETYFAYGTGESTAPSAPSVFEVLESADLYIGPGSALRFRHQPMQ